MTNQHRQLPSRLAIFIDGSNLYHSLEENCGRFDVDFRAFAQKLAKDRTLLRVYYYNVLRDQNRNPQAYQDQQKFLTALDNTPYLEVRLGRSKIRGDTAVEKGVDIMISTDMLRLAWEDRYDVATLVSGDGDFASLPGKVEGNRPSYSLAGAGHQYPLSRNTQVHSYPPED